jgi:hypothetical protein
MTTILNDRRRLEAVGPSDVAAYLRSHNWKQVEQIGDRATVWTKPSDTNEEFEVVLPLRPSTSEYARRMAELLETITIAEHQDADNVARNITLTSSDTVTIRLSHPALRNGSIPLQFAGMVATGIRNMMLAVAKVTNMPEPVYRTTSTYTREQYVDNLTLGPIAGDRFTLLLESAVPPALHVDILNA